MIKTVLECDLCKKVTDLIKYQEQHLVTIDIDNKLKGLKTNLQICPKCYSKIENAVEIIKQEASNANHTKQTKTDFF